MNCSLCGQNANLIYKQLPGYQEGVNYDVYECQRCDLQFVSPLAVNPGLYDLIYNNINTIGGYKRYSEYADCIGKTKDPLSYLSNCEEAYHFVYSTLTALARNRNSRILEVGSGLGYLTYAMNKAGYQTLGIDVSQNAVNDATLRFGDFYKCIDVSDIVNSDAKFDIIVLTEVLEHVVDIFKLLDSLDKLLSPSGFILLTTPNKSFYPNTYVWHTELPPVHLWWFGESTMRLIALKYNYDVKFYDYTNWNESFQAGGATLSYNRQLIRDVSPVLTRSGNVKRNDKSRKNYEVLTAILKNNLILKKGIEVYRILCRGQKISTHHSSMTNKGWDTSRSIVMGVVFQKSA